MQSNDKAKLMVTTREVLVGGTLGVPEGEECALVGRSDDGRPIVQFPHHKRPWLLEKDEVRFRWPFAGLGLAAHHSPQHSRFVVTDGDHGRIAWADSLLVLRRTQALYVFAGELSKELWDVSLLSREDCPDVLEVGTVGGLLGPLEKRMTEMRDMMGLVRCNMNHEWLP